MFSFIRIGKAWQFERLLFPASVRIYTVGFGREKLNMRLNWSHCYRFWRVFFGTINTKFANLVYFRFPLSKSTIRHKDFWFLIYLLSRNINFDRKKNDDPIFGTPSSAFAGSLCFLSRSDVGFIKPSHKDAFYCAILRNYQNSANLDQIN